LGIAVQENIYLPFWSKLHVSDINGLNAANRSTVGFRILMVFGTWFLWTLLRMAWSVGTKDTLVDFFADIGVTLADFFRSFSKTPKEGFNATSC
jgi:hypothetical protein